mmetsp:Transcript_20005/g.37176  ORF Transcript_20005/g.37176 Transcript_20005/m.37176 type:complete len:88 (+) Transcript_20005:3769-4032(+)
MRLGYVKGIRTSKTVKHCPTCANTILTKADTEKHTLTNERLIGRSTCGDYNGKHTTYIWRSHRKPDKKKLPGKCNVRHDLVLGEDIE